MAEETKRPASDAPRPAEDGGDRSRDIDLSVEGGKGMDVVPVSVSPDEAPGIGGFPSTDPQAHAPSEGTPGGEAPDGGGAAPSSSDEGPASQAS